MQAAFYGGGGSARGDPFTHRRKAEPPARCKVQSHSAVRRRRSEDYRSRGSTFAHIKSRGKVPAPTAALCHMRVALHRDCDEVAVAVTVNRSSAAGGHHTSSRSDSDSALPMESDPDPSESSSPHASCSSSSRSRDGWCEAPDPPADADASTAGPLADPDDIATAVTAGLASALGCEEVAAPAEAR